MTDPYDELPYKSRAFAVTHPASLATMARLFGVSATVPTHARVLELGCASGGNLIPMAHALPEAHFVGTDLNAAGIQAARERSASLGLHNTQWVAGDLGALPELGSFDYIIAHGVYSWVPTPVQTALLAVCKRHLSPNGVAYVSYNTMPGWAHRQALRTMGLFHAGQRDTLADQLGQVRALVNLVRQATPENKPLRALLEEEHRHFSAMPDWYVTHEHLGANNEALWFYEFIERATAHGLQFLGEAELRDMVAADLPPDIREQVEALGTDQLRLEQYLDFVRNRTFRRTLLVHDDAPIQRDIPLERIADMHVAAALASRPSEPTPSEHPTPIAADVESDPVWQALQHHLPASAPVQDIVDTVGGSYDDVANRLFSHVLQGSAQLSVLPLPGGPVTAQPVASRIARDEVARGESWVTNQRHQGIQLDPYMVALLPLLDGSRDHDALVEALADAVASQAFELLNLDHEHITDRTAAVPVLREGLPRALDVLAYYALLE